MLFVTEVPPTIDHLGGHGPFLRNPSGFSPRLYHLMSALADRCPVDLVGVHTDARDLDRPFFEPGLNVRRYRPVFVGRSPLGEPGWVGRAHRARQFLFGALPRTCHPRRSADLAGVIAADGPSLVVLYLPHLAHLASRVPRGVPVVCVLEEGWERLEAWGVDQRATGRRRGKWINATEQRRAAHLYRRVGRRAAAVVVISESEREWFGRWIPPDRTVVIPHGVDCEYFRPRAGADVLTDIDVAVFGLLSHPRNGEPAQEVFKAAQRSGEGWTWGFVGPAGEAFSSTVDSPRALVTGYVPDVRPYYARSKVVLVPALNGTGVKTTVLQAWAMGRPVVATPFSVAGLPARPGDNVLIGRSPDELLGQVARLLDSAELRRRLEDAGRQTAVEWRDIRMLARRFADVCGDAARS